MKKLFLIFLVISSGSMAQTGIGTTAPHASAKLDVSATNKGFLPPRVSLTGSSDVTTIASPAEGLLVYNLGSVGLQAGYYYWNGANWATIATATLAGNAVVASDLVKLYQEVYSTTAGKASSSDGYSFTVPASGRYEFNFNCTGWNSNGSKIKLTFNVRQGTTVLGTDYHESTSSNAWAEYEGRVEVNLSAGVTYNAQIVTTTGNRTAAADWDKIMYKMVAGNLPINQFNLGDVKTGIQSGDHNGWVKLDGRLKSTLTASQQLQATALGIGNNLPDATDAVLVQSSGSLGSVTGSMSRTIAQNQLPNVTPTITVGNTTSTMQSAGAHNHSVRIVPNPTGGYANGYPSAFKTGMAPNEGDADITDRVVNAFYANTNIIGNADAHSHIMDVHGHTASSSSINGGVTQQSIDITPRKLVVNTFIYLGN